MSELSAEKIRELAQAEKRERQEACGKELGELLEILAQKYNCVIMPVARITEDGRVIGDLMIRAD